MLQEVAIYANILLAMRTLLTISKELGVLDAIDDQDSVMLIWKTGYATGIDESVGRAVKSLWEDSVVQQVFMTHYVPSMRWGDSLAYYASDIERIAGPCYEVTLEDFLRVRVRTSGILSYL